MDQEEIRLIEKAEPTDSSVERLTAENHGDAWQLEHDPQFIEISLQGADLCQEGIESIVHHAAVTAVGEHRRALLLEQQGADRSDIEERRKRAQWFERIAKKEGAPAVAYHELETPISAQLEKANAAALENARLALSITADKPPQGVFRERLHKFVQSEARLYRIGEALHDLQSVTAGAAAPDFRRLAIKSGQEAERLEGVATRQVAELTKTDLELTQRLAESRLASGDEGAPTPLLAAEHAEVQQEISAVRKALANRSAKADPATPLAKFRRSGPPDFS